MKYIASESVTEGHPDKICDQISDGILDAVLKEDPKARVAIETMVTPGLIHIGGELTTTADYIDIPEVAREVMRKIGNSASLGLPADSVAIIPTVSKQSTEIEKAVNQKANKQLGAGDQGMMFGYASNETSELMPLPIALAHALSTKLTQVRKNNFLSYLRPDGKTQVVLKYQNGIPIGIKNILISSQHAASYEVVRIKDDLMEHVVKPVLEQFQLSTMDFEFLVNPSGSFIVGGATADTGLTGRKIIQDAYGGSGKHGGGAFSGKDATKVDRSAAYAMRWVAKNIVAAGLADRVETQVAYAIGLAEPVGFSVETFGTGKMDDADIEMAVASAFDLRPQAIIEMLDLLKPIYSQTSVGGHFGKAHLTWEQTNMIDDLKRAIR
jgi:S-adenosylmethionine synthetase